MNVLVTGGAGFIGSHLVHRLVDRGDRVRVLDNFSTAKRGNLTELEGKFELIEGDVEDIRVCQRACDSIQIVFHHAALPSVPKSIEDPDKSHCTNTNGTFNMLLAAREAKVKRFIYAASSSAYGDSEQLPKIESMISNPLSPYAVQKLTGENYCRVFSSCYHLETLSLRYFNVFGPRQDPSSQYAAAIPAFVTSILKDEPPVVYGDGEQTRDFTYIDNAVNANLLAAEAPAVHGEAINVACGERITVNEIITRINTIVGKNIKATYVDPRPGDIKHSWADIDLANKLIGYRPAIGFEEGLRRTIEWFTRSI